MGSLSQDGSLVSINDNRYHFSPRSSVIAATAREREVHMPSLTVSRRKLWTMKCESLFQILASSLSPEVLEKFCRKHRLPGPMRVSGKADWYQWAHEQCHKDSPF